MNSMIAKIPERRERFFRYAPLIIWIVVIFILSSAPGSMSNTSRFIRPLLIFLFPNATEETLILYHGYIRKSAHFIAYAILGFWAARAFFGSSRKFLQTFWLPVSFGLVILVASLDEFNQSFNQARTGSIYDVLLDAAGGLTMLIIFAIVCRVFGKKNGRL